MKISKRLGKIANNIIEENNKLYKKQKRKSKTIKIINGTFWPDDTRQCDIIIGKDVFRVIEMNQTLSIEENSICNLKLEWYRELKKSDLR
jgi:hypothetical protein